MGHLLCLGQACLLVSQSLVSAHSPLCFSPHPLCCLSAPCVLPCGKAQHQGHRLCDATNQKALLPLLTRHAFLTPLPRTLTTPIPAVGSSLYGTHSSSEAQASEKRACLLFMLPSSLQLRASSLMGDCFQRFLRVEPKCLVHTQQLSYLHLFFTYAVIPPSPICSFREPCELGRGVHLTSLLTKRKLRPES